MEGVRQHGFRTVLWRGSVWLAGLPVRRRGSVRSHLRLLLPRLPRVTVDALCGIDRRTRL